MPYPTYSSDVDFCRDIHKRYGKSFYLGTLLLSKEERDATCILYAFFRFPDEYVDTYYSDEKNIALAKIGEWRASWEDAYRGNLAITMEESQKKILRATAYIFKKYDIPYDYSEAFFLAMIQDTHKERYATYEELEHYMYGSAAVVGLMMTYVLFSGEKRFAGDLEYRKDILDKAQALGEAFQMTNFLRDIGEDITLRGRKPPPLQDMQKFTVTENDIQKGKITESFISLMKFEILRTQELYLKADKGIAMLPTRARKGIYTARMVYSKIIPKIQTAGYDVFSSRAHLSLIEKIGASLPALIK
jgi:phytoene synthase